MLGDPCYQPYRCMEYFQLFNNQNQADKKATKILLNLPLIKKEHLECVVLSYENNNRMHNHHWI